MNNGIDETVSALQDKMFCMTEQFQQALRSRDVIGQAKGILMVKMKSTDVEAFELLIRASNESHVKVIEISRRVVARHLTMVAAELEVEDARARSETGA